MRNQINQILSGRILSELSPQNPIKYLQGIEVDAITCIAIRVLFLYTRPSEDNGRTALLAEVCTAIGHRVRKLLGLPLHSGLAAKTGAFILYTFEVLNILHIDRTAGKNNHQVFKIVIDDYKVLDKMWALLPNNQMEKLPSLIPYESWKSYSHPAGINIVKTRSKQILHSIKLETHPMLFACLNKAQAVGWKVNNQIYPLVAWGIRNKVDAFSDIWGIQQPEARRSKLRETMAVENIAGRFLEKTFYHLYYFDFRGRKYPFTAYFHEQGSDLARGLLLRADKKPITKEGYYWLLISLASNFAGDAKRADGQKTDKIPFVDRIRWAKENEIIFLAYADNPKINQGWMHADKPWQFLAACMELRNLHAWQRIYGQNNFEYETSLEVFIDGSCNGSQHLSALTRDDITAVYVNLLPSALPGDLYKYIAECVWQRIEKDCSEFTSQEFLELDGIIDRIIVYKSEIGNLSPKSERRKLLIEELRAWRANNKTAIAAASPLFWKHIVDPKHRRKIVKRNVMVLPYGGTPFGLAEQQIKDARKHGIELLMHMEARWGSYMGRLVFNVCKQALERPMQLLSVFEVAGKKAEDEGRFLSWQVPITNFPVEQHYTEGTVHKTWVQYGPPKGARLTTGYFENTYQLHICFLEEHKMSKGKQAQGAAPNVIHSLDAAHLTMTVSAADFPVTTIHDSFGCLLPDMPKLFVIVREQFVKLYESNPLEYIMTQIGGDINEVKFGILDINSVLKSEYCFA